MRICILGAGSLGSAIGGLLGNSGHDVTLITRNRQHVDAITMNGLILHIEHQKHAVQLKAATSTTGMAPFDLIIVLVKSLDTRSAITAARQSIGPETVVISLQNGLGQEALLAEILGARQIIAGKTYIGGVMLAPGHVIVSAKGKETIIGEIDGSRSARVRAIAATFTRAGLETVASENIMGAMWDKLLVNVATGALAGITGLPYGDLYALPEIEATAIEAVAEAITIARTLSIAIQTSDPRAPWLKARSGLPPEFRTSMLQSLDKGALTEIDFINGAVVHYGKTLGIPTPVNSTLVALIKGVERRIIAPPTAMKVN